MKNQNLYKRFLCSLKGLRAAWESEKSFRTQVVITLVIIPTIIFLKASALWWGIFLLIIGATLASELFNTALEGLCDHVRPEIHPQIGRIKDCAAAAVFMLSLASCLIFLTFLLEKFGYLS